MNLSIDKNLPHPRFLVIDSPLTAHEETDGPIETGIQNAFFDYFANYKKGQVIILENKEPSKEIQEKVKYYRFTGVKGIPRSGFFPPIS